MRVKLVNFHTINLSDYYYSGFPLSEADPHDLLQLLALVDPVDGDEARRHHVQQVATGPPKDCCQDVDQATSHHTNDNSAHANENTLILNNLAKITTETESRMRNIQKDSLPD